MTDFVTRDGGPRFAPTLVWRNPPKVGRRESVEIEAHLIAAQLQDRPEQWAEVWTGGASGAARRKTLLVEKGCEVTTTRGEHDGQRIVFARYLGTANV